MWGSLAKDLERFFRGFLVIISKSAILRKLTLSLDGTMMFKPRWLLLHRICWLLLGCFPKIFFFVINHFIARKPSKFKFFWIETKSTNPALFKNFKFSELVKGSKTPFQLLVFAIISFSVKPLDILKSSNFDDLNDMSCPFSIFNKKVDKHQ